MKKILFSALMACFALTASAQISEGAPSAKKYTTGNRPLKGTFGLYVGAETDLFQDKLQGVDDPNFEVLPIVNLKYMATDNLELRVGMRFWKQRYSFVGTNDADTDAGILEEKQSAKAVQSSNEFRPGFAYHFTKSNLLDVYAGIEGLIGWQRTNATSITSYTLDNQEGYLNVRDARITFGANAFIGLQAFIARLPLAIGLEYGFGTRWDGAIRQKTVSKPNNDTDETVTYTIGQDAADNGWNAFAAGVPQGQRNGVYDGMKARKGAWGSQVRLTLSYYFNR